METGQETTPSSPVITRPEDSGLIERLKRKQEEYLGRIGDEFTHPEQAIFMGIESGNLEPLDAYIKHKLLTKVLEDGSVETWEFSRQIANDLLSSGISEVVLPHILDSTATACAVIHAYCSDNLSVVRGGTGLQ